MSKSWCIEYTQLTIRAESIQKEYDKIKDKIQFQLKLGEKTTTNINPPQRQKFELKLENRDAKSDRQEQALYEKILRLRRYCRTAKCALMDIVTNTNNEKRKLKIEQAKSICKKAIKSYEDEYERMREMCSAEVERLEMKSREIQQSLVVDLESFENYQ